MNVKKNNLSGCLITLNAEKDIKKCICNIKDYVNEIIVVDAGSHDRTLEIAKSCGAQLFKRKCKDDFASQRNYAIQKAKGEWIFFLDTDEICSEALLNNFQKFINNKHSIDGYLIRRKNYLDGKLMKKKDYQLRLFRRYGYYIGRVHEVVEGLRKIEKAEPDNQFFIIHSKIKNEQKKHLLSQKKIMLDDLKEAKNKNDQQEVSRITESLRHWQRWWKEAQ
jgi:glycosyltransferase involved in cell wall biosynthesis